MTTKLLYQGISMNPLLIKLETFSLSHGVFLPGSVWLLGSGLGFLAWSRKRR